MKGEILAAVSSVFVERLNATQKAYMLIASIATGAFLAGLAASSQLDVPHRLANVEVYVNDTLKVELRDLQLKLNQIEASTQLNNCLIISEAQGSDWRTCLN